MEELSSRLRACVRVLCFVSSSVGSSATDRSPSPDNREGGRTVSALTLHRRHHVPAAQVSLTAIPEQDPGLVQGA
eukprot:16436020-Heterocapsa_arctica.AAC.1